MRLRISAWGIQNPIPVAILFVALTLTGLIAYANLPIKHYPNISFPAVSVTVTQNGAAPSEMESQITRPVENAVAGLTNVKHISSSVVLGSSTTTIEFELGSDLQKAVDDVRSAVDRTRAILPNGIDPPTVQRIEIDSAPILTYALSSPNMSVAELSWFIDDTVARALQAQRGVAQISRVGGVDREVNVVIDPDRMAALGVTAPQVNDALRSFNTDVSGGRATIGGGEQTLRVLGQAANVAQIRDITIPVAGRFVKLTDVAEVGDGSGEQRQFARLDAAPTVGFQVNKTKVSSDVTVETEVQKAIKTLQAENPKVKFTEIVSTVKSTRDSYEETVRVLLEGMGLAALVVLVFLRNGRAVIIPAVAVVVSLLGSLAVMYALHFSLDSLSLMALTVATGFVVDDAQVWGRPVGVAVAADGALLFSDDGSGTLWRVAPVKGR